MDLAELRHTPPEEAGSITIGDIQRVQAEYDVRYWTHQGPPRLIKIRHILLHLSETLGRLATWCEAAEHGTEPSTDILQTKVTPDLQFHAAQLAEVLGIDLGAAYVARIDSNASKREAAMETPPPAP